MAAFVVDTTADTVNAGDGKLSLREAVAQANATTAADRIAFSADLEGKTLTLTGGAMALTEDLTIVGDRDGNGIGVSIDGNRQTAAYGLFSGDHMFDVVERSTAVSLHGLTLTNGYGHNTASAILVDGGSLTISNCTL